MSKKVQFIAGAICSHCGHQDTIKRILVDNNTFTTECVDCGHSQTHPGQKQKKTVLSVTVPKTPPQKESS